MNTEIMRFSQGLQGACTSLATNLKNAELSSADSLAKTRRQFLQDEEEAKSRAQSLNEALARSQSKLIETEGRLMELTQKNQALAGEVSVRNMAREIQISSCFIYSFFKFQIADRDRVLNTLRRLRTSLPPPELESGGDMREFSSEDPIAATRRMIEQVYSMHQALSQIAQVGFLHY